MALEPSPLKSRSDFETYVVLQIFSCVLANLKAHCNTLYAQIYQITFPFKASIQNLGW